MKNRLLIYALCALCGFRASAGETFGPMTFHGDVAVSNYTNTIPVTNAVVATNGGLWAATATWHYAVSGSNVFGALEIGTVTNGTLATTNGAITVQWNQPGGMTGLRLWRGSAAGTLTQFVRLAVGAYFTDKGTNAWTAGTHANTMTNDFAFVLPDGTRLNGAGDLGSITGVNAAVSGIGFANPAGPGPVLTGTVSAAVTYGHTTNTAYNGANGTAAFALASNAAAGNLATSNTLAKYLPLTGGTLSDSLTITNSAASSASLLVNVGAFDTAFAAYITFGYVGGTATNVQLVPTPSGYLQLLQPEEAGVISDNGWNVMLQKDITNIGGALFVLKTGDTMAGPLTNNAGYFGNGAGLTNLPVSGGGNLAALSNATPRLSAVSPLEFHGFRSQTTNASILPQFGIVGGDALTATSGVTYLTARTSSTNTEQECFATAKFEWRFAGATNLVADVWFQTITYGQTLRFNNKTGAVWTVNLTGTTANTASLINIPVAGTVAAGWMPGDLITCLGFWTNKNTNATTFVGNGIAPFLEHQR